VKHQRRLPGALARIGAALVAASLSAACAPVPKPTVLGDVERVQSGRAATEARTYAPSAYAHADKLRREADEAFAAGDTAGSQLLGERALAAYGHALALARIARADADKASADEKLAATQRELASLEEEQLRLSAEADALERKIRVARDAQPIQPSDRADPERERARLAAARSLALEARLLCGAAKLLAGASNPTPDPKSAADLDAAAAALTKLDEALGPSATAAPIDEATRARAGCLAALTAHRRVATPVTKAPGTGDALLAEISAMGKLSPSRDDRGVFVTLRGLFKGNALTAEAKARLEELGRIAAAHPAFPIEVVVHNDKPVSAKDEAAQKARAEAVKGVIAGAGGGARIEAIVAGNAAPVVDPSGSDRARNARVEIVFVTPEAL